MTKAHIVTVLSIKLYFVTETAGAIPVNPLNSAKNPHLRDRELTHQATQTNRAHYKYTAVCEASPYNPLPES
jgi:hypothetical protein